MADIFADPKSLITGAYEDIEDLERSLAAFFQKKPYSRVVERDPNDGRETHKIKLTEKFPEPFSRRAAHVANDLRSALDQAGYACAVASGKTAPKYTYFPIASDAAQLDNTVKGRCKHLPPEISSLFRAFNAHKGGDGLLWALNEIANSRKHRVIVPLGQDIGGAFISTFQCRGRVLNLQIPPKWDAVKNEAVLCVVEKGANPYYKLNFAFIVAFHKIDVVGGMPVTATLRALARKVEGIVAATEAEAKRIGLVS